MTRSGDMREQVRQALGITDLGRVSDLFELFGVEAPLALSASLPANLEPCGDQPRPGEIRLAYWQTGRGRRGEFVLVLDSDDETRYAQIALISTDVDRSVNTDVLLSPERTGLPFSVVAQTALIGPVLHRDMSGPLGVVSMELFVAIRELALPRPLRLVRGSVEAVPPGLLGLKVTGPTDPLYSFVQSRVELLTQMTAACVDELWRGKPKIGEADPDPVIARAHEWLTNNGDRALRRGTVAFIEPVAGHIAFWHQTSLASPPLPAPGTWTGPRPSVYEELASQADASLLLTGQQTPFTEERAELVAGVYEIALEHLDARLVGVLDSSLGLEPIDDHSVEVIVGVRVHPRLGEERLRLERLRLTLVVATSGGVLATRLMRKQGPVDIYAPGGLTRTYSARLPLGMDQLQALEPVFGVALRRPVDG